MSRATISAKIKDFGTKVAGVMETGVRDAKTKENGAKITGTEEMTEAIIISA